MLAPAAYEFHLFVGSTWTMPAKTPGTYTVAPGAYPYKFTSSTTGALPATQWVKTVNSIPAGAKFIAHAVVEGDFSTGVATAASTTSGRLGLPGPPRPAPARPSGRRLGRRA